MVANDINQHLPCDKSGNINTPNDVAHGDYIYTCTTHLVKVKSKVHD